MLTLFPSVKKVTPIFTFMCFPASHYGAVKNAGTQHCHFTSGEMGLPEPLVASNQSPVPLLSNTLLPTFPTALGGSHYCPHFTGKTGQERLAKMPKANSYVVTGVLPSALPVRKQLLLPLLPLLLPEAQEGKD